MLIPFQDLDPASKVWIFQSENKFTELQATSIKEELFNFLQEWTAHNVQLYTSGDIIQDRFIVIMVDERFQGASGCSLDKMTHFIQHLEQKYDVTLLDRMKVAYEFTNNDEIRTTHLNQLSEMKGNGMIDQETYVYNNLVKTKAEFEQGWKTKIKDSWHNRFM